MKLIILAAGLGTRLKPLTNNRPKCLVKFQKKPIIDHILETAFKCRLSDISVVAGYKNNILLSHLNNQKIKFYINYDYNRTNMVFSLFCAAQELNGSDDVIISYSDIIYNKKILNTLINDNSNIAVVVDKKWKKLWEIRMDDPLSDAESMKIDKNKNIIELGKKTANYDDIQGQYIGLIKIKKNVVTKIVDFYKYNLSKNTIYNGENFNNIYMTSFIQMIIDKLTQVKAVCVAGGWIEIDSLTDINKYNAVNIIKIRNLD